MPSCCGLWDLYHVLVNLWGRRHCEVQLLDAVCMGRDKWLGGELGQDGCVYGIPGGMMSCRAFWKSWHSRFA
eukprot:g1817.t1